MLEVGHGGMTDDEYKAHFTMWALVKSPLLIGADIRHLPPSALTILNNPAIIAINQDPAGRSAHRIRVDYNVKKDRYGVGEAQLWSGPLANGDQVVAFLNAADEDLNMEAGLDEIFVDDGPGGSAPHVKQSWDVHDLWGARMSDKVAKGLLAASDVKDGGKAQTAFKAANWYNSTEISYREGIEKEDQRLFGTRIGVVRPMGSLKAKVARHSVAVFRLRSEDKSSKRYSIHKEL
jgi:alpha-galactosidase